MPPARTVIRTSRTYAIRRSGSVGDGDGFHHRFTGRLEGPFCHGRGKVARLWVELGTADLSGATAYSDSMSDLPLLTAAGAPVAVNPDRRLRREARTQGWPVLTF